MPASTRLLSFANLFIRTPQFKPRAARGGQRCAGKPPRVANGHLRGIHLQPRPLAPSRGNRARHVIHACWWFPGSGRLAERHRRGNTVSRRFPIAHAASDLALAQLLSRGEKVEHKPGMGAQDRQVSPVQGQSRLLPSVVAV